MKMKSSSSSSSLSLASKTQTFGCISLILHRFLCSRTLSTNPSDQTTETSLKSPASSSETSRAKGDAPGAVARLMGLDSVPVVSRSLSVKSTMEYVELEDDKFFILSFEKRRETRENQQTNEEENNINAMNIVSRLEIGELKQRRKQERKRRRRKRREIIKSRRDIEKENLIERYGRFRDEEEVEECGSCDDSSPVSVLDYDWFYGARETPLPGSSSRRRLSSELESTKLSEMVQEEHITSTSGLNIQHHSYQEMWLMICRLTVSEIEGSNWVYGKDSNLEDFEGIISEDIVSNILDQLLEETITTLSLTSQM